MLRCDGEAEVPKVAPEGVMELAAWTRGKQNRSRAPLAKKPDRGPAAEDCHASRPKLVFTVESSPRETGRRLSLDSSFERSAKPASFSPHV